MGGAPQLAHPEIVTDSKIDRCELHTSSKGVVHVEFQVVEKGCDAHGVSFLSSGSGAVAKRTVD